MNLFRLIFLASLVWLIYRFVQKWKVTIEPREEQLPPTPPPPGRVPTDLVLARCTKCGVLVPTATLNRSGSCTQCSSRNA